MKKIAIPVSNNSLDVHFGHCKEFFFYEIEDNKILNEIQLAAPPHEPGFLPKWLSEHKVTDVIAGGIGHQAINLLNNNNINVHIGAYPKSQKEIVEDFLKGTLQLSGNSCNH